MSRSYVVNPWGWVCCVRTLNSMAYPLAERCESAYGFGGGGWNCCPGINSHDLQLTRGMENGWNFHTRIL